VAAGGERAELDRSRTTSHAVHQSLWAQAVAREDLLVALKVDRVRQLTEDLADELIRVPGTAQGARGFLVRSGHQIGGHTMSIRAALQPGIVAIGERVAV